MPFVPAPNVAMFEVVGTKDGQIIENRMYVDCLHAPTLGDLAGIRAIVLSWCNAHYAPLLPSEVTINMVRVTDVSQQNGAQDIATVTIPGTVAGGALPNEVSFCVSLRSAVRGRSARGRWYMLGVAKSNVTAQNRVGGAYATAAVTALDQLITDLKFVNLQPIICSFVTNNAPRVGGPVYFILMNAVATDDVVDSQRRRRPGIGQ